MTLPVLRPHFPQDNGCFVHLLFTLVQCTPCNYEAFRIWQDTLAYKNCKYCFCSHIEEATFLFFEASIVWMVMQVKPL